MKLCRPDGYVYASLSPDSRRRDFNSPWAAEFFLEMYKLTGERPYLEKAYELLLAVVRRTGTGTSIMIESPDAELVKTLKTAGMTAAARAARSSIPTASTADRRNSSTRWPTTRTGWCSIICETLHRITAEN